MDEIKKSVKFVDLIKKKKKPEDKKDDDKKDSNAGLRDKHKEFKEHLEFLKKELSPEALEAIKQNPDKMDEIIKGLKKRGELGKEYDVRLEKFTSKIKRKNKEDIYKHK